MSSLYSTLYSLDLFLILISSDHARQVFLWVSWKNVLWQYSMLFCIDEQTVSLQDALRLLNSSLKTLKQVCYLKLLQTRLLKEIIIPFIFYNKQALQYCFYEVHTSLLASICRFNVLRDILLIQIFTKVETWQTLPLQEILKAFDFDLKLPFLFRTSTHWF